MVREDVIQRKLEEWDRKWEEHAKEHGGIDRALETGGITMRSLKDSIPAPLTLSDSFKKYFIQVLGLIGAMWGFYRTLATMDYVDKALTVHSHSEEAHPSIVKSVERFSRAQDQMQRDLWELMGKNSSTKEIK